MPALSKVEGRVEGLTLGHDLKTRQPVTLDASRARVLLICGKRGSGKSYTLGVLAEELFHQTPRPCLLIVDPVGIFWTMSQSADPEKPGLPPHQTVWWGGLPLQLLVPGEPTRLYPESLRTHFTRCGIMIARLTLDPAELSSDAWCELFALSINEPLGIALARAVQSLTGSTTSFDLDAVEEALQRDPLSQDRTKEALLNRLSIAKSWGLFETTAADVTTTVTPARVNVLDLAVLDYGPQGLRSLVLAIVARRLFTHHQRLRQQAVASDAALPKLWLLIDEAHQFIPQGASTLAKDTLIRWVKEGRQPGLSCVLASQQPGSLDQDVLSQCDALISHKLTNLEDLQAANRLSQAYMGSELKVYLRHLKQPGQAVLVDDARERVAMLQVRPRRTCHGGGEL